MFLLGGVEAKAFEFPHQVLLGYKKEGAHKIYWACGGSLISPNFVLTGMYSRYFKASHKFHYDHVSFSCTLP